MRQAAGDGGQVVEADGDVVGTILEDGPPLVLGKIPPCLRFGDGDQGRRRCFGPSEGRLGCRECIPLAAFDVALVARHPPQEPSAAKAEWPGSLDHVDAGHVLEAEAGDSGQGFDVPGPMITADEADLDRSGHGLTLVQAGARSRAVEPPRVPR